MPEKSIVQAANLADILSHPAWNPPPGEHATWVSWDYQKQRWWWICTFTTAYLPRKAGFIWDWRNRQWFCTDASQVARHAIEYCNPSAIAALAAAEVCEKGPRCRHGKPRTPRVICLRCSASQRAHETELPNTCVQSDEQFESATR
jgi:hypothetical protein